MTVKKSLATKVRQALHSKKQRMYYKLGIRKRGYSPKFREHLESLKREQT